MKNAMTILMLSAVVMFVVTPAVADWQIGDPYKMHSPQLPDLSPTGLNVLATTPKVLADDFQCIETGKITDIHIWGSWLNDYLPGDPGTAGGGDPGNVTFSLSLHKDIPDPDGLTGPRYSMPGELLWDRTFKPGEFRHKFWENSTEGFFDPNQNEIIGTDTMVFQYNFSIPGDEAFMQEEGTIYWLDVMAIPTDPNALFGWKSSRDHWNDDGVYGDWDDDGTFLGWKELRYPAGSQFEGQSIDLSFVIVPEPATMTLLVLGGIGVLLKRRRK